MRLRRRSRTNSRSPWRVSTDARRTPTARPKSSSRRFAAAKARELFRSARVLGGLASDILGAKGARASIVHAASFAIRLARETDAPTVEDERVTRDVPVLARQE